MSTRIASFTGYLDDDGSFRLFTHVEDGQTLTCGDVNRLVLIPALAENNARAGLRIPTNSERAAMDAKYAAECALPDGWSASLDGVNQELVIGGPTVLTKRFVRDDGKDVVVPVGDMNGTPIPETRATLLAFDRDNPRAVVAEA